jgi:hypothetical protein
MKRYAALSIIVAILVLLPAIARAQVNARGHITLLRVHDVGTAYGPPTDRIDVEVVVTLDSEPGKAFGFQLRTDTKLPARQGMLDLLRDAYANNSLVSIDYTIAPGKKNGILIRTWLSR